MNRVFPNLRIHFAKDGSRLAEVAAFNSSSQIRWSLSPLCFAWNQYNSLFNPDTRNQILTSGFRILNGANFWTFFSVRFSNGIWNSDVYSGFFVQYVFPGQLDWNKLQRSQLVPFYCENIFSYTCIKYSNGRSIGYFLCTRPTIQTMDQYRRKQDGIHANLVNFGLSEGARILG